VERVAVCSRSFSKNSILRKELLARYENVTFNDEGMQLDGDKLIDFLKDHDKAITGLERIDGSVLSKLPNLKAIGKYGVGLDMIDLNAMSSFGVRLGWIGGVNRRSVSELVLAFAITMLRKLDRVNLGVRTGEWISYGGSQLTGKCFGIIGCGNIGQDLIRLLKSFECKIFVHDLVEYKNFFLEHEVIFCGLDELLEKSDIVSIHTPYNNNTKNILDNKKLALMKASAILINTARGGLVDEVALKNMLQSKKLAGAAFDVFCVEPPEDQELLKMENFYATPHIGGSTEEAILAMGRAAIDGLDENEIPKIK